MREYEAFIGSFRDKIGKANNRGLVLVAEILLNNGHTEKIYNPEVLGEAATTGTFIRGIRDRTYTEIFPGSIAMIKYGMISREQAQSHGVSVPAPKPQAQAPAPAAGQVKK